MSTSTWMTEVAMPKTPVLAQNLTVDVCIVGAGISGLTTAYLMLREGLSVAVLDSGALCSGETERTTAHLASALDDRFYILERMHGQVGAKLAYESHAAAISRIERLVHDEAILCDFERLDAFLVVPPEESADILRVEQIAAERAGVADVEFVARVPVSGWSSGPALRFGQQAQFHPLSYCAGLARAIVKRRGRIFTHSHVVRVEGGPKAFVQTERGHRVRAKAIVVATNSPMNDRIAVHTKQEPYRTYVVALDIPHEAVPRALYWDTGDPYHYVRLHETPAGTTRIIVGGEDHKTGEADDADRRWQRLETWTRERFPAAGAVINRWSGQVLEPIDCLAFIGRNPLDADNVYIATGDSGHGMTHGTIAGILITDLVFGRKNAWASLYDPTRKTLSSAGEFLKNSLDVARHYGDWLTPGDVRAVDQIPVGQGAVVREGLSLQAVYRDDAGRLHKCSAVCPHLGGIVQWNSAEKSWDCPVHGSRFSAVGDVVNGPAATRLKRLETPTVEAPAFERPRART